MRVFWELRQDGESMGLREPTALEKLTLQALYRFFESGAIKATPLEAMVGNENAFILHVDDAQEIIATVGRLVKSQSQAEKQPDPSGGKYRIISKVCKHCGGKYHAKVVLSELACKHCGAAGGFAREAGQKQALLLCAECGQDFLYSFDTRGDRTAHYKADVDADIARRRKDLQRVKERAGTSKRWAPPSNIVPRNIGD